MAPPLEYQIRYPDATFSTPETGSPWRAIQDLQ